MNEQTLQPNRPPALEAPRPADPGAAAARRRLVQAFIGERDPPPTTSSPPYSAATSKGHRHRHTGTLQPRDYVDVGARVSVSCARSRPGRRHGRRPASCSRRSTPTVYRARVDASRPVEEPACAAEGPRAQLALAQISSTPPARADGRGRHHQGEPCRPPKPQRVREAQPGAARADRQIESTLRRQGKPQYARILSPMARHRGCRSPPRQGERSTPTSAGAGGDAHRHFCPDDRADPGVEPTSTPPEARHGAYFTTLGGGGKRWHGRANQAIR